MNTNQLLGHLILSFFTILACNDLLYSQNIVASLGTGQTLYKEHFENKGNPNLTIQFTPITTAVDEWSYRAPNAGITSLTGVPGTSGSTVSRNIGNNLVAEFSDNTVTIVNNGSEPSVGSVPLELQVRFGGTSLASKTYDIVIRQPLAMVFVFDRSGSMECEPDEPLGLAGWDSCTSDTDDKWLMLTDAARLFMQTLDNQDNRTKLDQDNFSVVYFDGAVQPSTIVSDAAGSRFLSREDFTTGTSSSPNTILDDVNAQISGGSLGRNGTSIGGGLENAILQKMNNVTGKRQIIVLVTDGQQNAGPMLAGSGDQINNASSTSTRMDGDSPAEPIEIFCLALDGNTNPASYGSLLTNLVNGGGRLFIANDPVPGNNTPQYEALMAEIFKDHSPQKVGTSMQTVSNGAFEETFEVNANGAQLQFIVSLDRGRAGAYRYRLERDGEDVTELATLRLGSMSATMTMDFQEHPELNSRGSWKISGQRNAVDFQAAQIVNPRVEIAAVIDEQELKADYSVGAQRLRVGDRLNPSVRLTVRGMPMDSATVTAELVKAGADKGDLVARAEDVPHQPEPGSEVNNAFSVKYGFLRRNNPQYLAPLALQNTTITLVPRGDGLYSGTFLPADVADNYTVIFRVQAQDSTLGTIHRYKRLTTSVRFGVLNHNAGQQSIMTSGGQGDGFTHTLTYTPTYEVNGQTRLVGPGYEHLFTLEGSEGTRISNVIDNGDGSYTLTVRSDQRNPKTTFYLLDEPFYVDRGIQGFDDPYLPYKTHLSVHGGLTQPLDTLDATYDGDFYVELDLGFYLAPRLELELIGGYYSFQPDFSVLGGSANLRYNLLELGAANNTGLTASAGLGVYGPKNEGATFGLNGRVGIQRQINQKLSLSLEGGLFWLPSPDYTWATVGLALRYGI